MKKRKEKNKQEKKPAQLSISPAVPARRLASHLSLEFFWPVNT
jgi:hypothetical protein